MANIKKPGMIDIVLIAVSVISFILVIVGVCMAYVSMSGVIDYSLSQLYDLQSLAGESITGLAAMGAFAYITLALSIVAALGLVVCKIFDIKASKMILIVLAVLLLVSSILALAMGYSFCNNEDNGSGELFAPAAGCWLVFIFGLIEAIAVALAGLNIFNKKNA